MSIAIIDCAVENPALVCFNRIASTLPYAFEYHWPARYGLKSLEYGQAQRSIILGSFSNIEDNLPWQKQLGSFMLDKLRAGHPILGLCFGLQLMAHHLGAEVVACPEKREGLRTFKMVKAFGPFTAQEKLTFIVQHSFEVAQLPQGFSTIGSSEHCHNDFIVHEQLPFWGVQGHPEASSAFIRDTLEPENHHLQVPKDGLSFIDLFCKHSF